MTPQELLGTMVAVDSVNSRICGRPENERKLASFIDETARAWGFKTRRIPAQVGGFDVLVECETKAGAPWLVLDAHMDTVSAEGMADAFGGKVRDGRLYGRGACDDKGPAAAMLFALKAYAAGAVRPNNVALLFSTDEEAGRGGAVAFLEALPSLGWRPAGMVVAEPTGFSPIIAHNGILRFVLRTTGLAAHSSTPEQGRSAVSMMVKVIDAMERDYIPGVTAPHPLTGGARCSINTIRGGCQSNVIPDDCAAQVDRRMAPGEKEPDVIAAVEAVLDKVRKTHPGLTVRQEGHFGDPPLDQDGTEPFVRWFMDTLRKSDPSVRPAGGPFATNAGQYITAGLPCVVYGPGDPSKAHTSDEWVDVAEIEKGVEAYLTLMRSPLGSSGK